MEHLRLLISREENISEKLCKAAGKFGPTYVFTKSRDCHSQFTSKDKEPMDPSGVVYENDCNECTKNMHIPEELGAN